MPAEGSIAAQLCGLYRVEKRDGLKRGMTPFISMEGMEESEVAMDDAIS